MADDMCDHADRRSVLRNATRIGVSAFAASVATACVAVRPPAQAQNPANTLTAAQMIGKSLRVFHSGDALTMDYSADRVNIELGPDDRIVSVTVG